MAVTPRPRCATRLRTPSPPRWAFSPKLAFRLTGTVDAPGTVVATLTDATPFGAASGGTITANAITDDTAATGNASPVATATLRPRPARWLSTAPLPPPVRHQHDRGLTVGAGDTVSCSSLTYSAPA